MRMESGPAERLDATAMRKKLEDEAPIPTDPMPPWLDYPTEFAAWKAGQDEARRIRADLLARHGWTMLDLLTAEMDARFTN